MAKGQRWRAPAPLPSLGHLCQPLRTCSGLPAGPRGTTGHRGQSRLPSPRDSPDPSQPTAAQLQSDLGTRPPWNVSSVAPWMHFEMNTLGRSWSRQPEPSEWIAW